MVHADMDVDSGTLTVSTGTVTVAGGSTVAGTLSIATGTVDIAGTFNTTGTLTFTGAGRLQLGGTVTSLGTFTQSTGTVEYDNTAAGQTIDADTYYNLEIDNTGQVALTGGDITVTNDLTITAGELEIDDGDTLEIQGAASVTGTLDVEPDATLELSGSTTLTVNSGGTYEALGTSTDYALTTTNDTGTPGRWGFTVSAGGILNSNYAFFQYMDASGLAITDNGAVTALTELDNTVFDHGAAGGVFISITSNDNAVSFTDVLFADSGGTPTYNVQTSAATATITFDTYGGAFGGAANEDDNGGGNVDPGFIIWTAQTPALVEEFHARPALGGVLLEWETASEWRTQGFAIERSAKGDDRFEPVGPACIPARGQSGDGGRYRFIDDSASSRRAYRYRLVELDAAGQRNVVVERETRRGRGLLSGADGVVALDSAAAGPGHRKLEVPEVAAPAADAERATGQMLLGRGQPVPVVKILTRGGGVQRVTLAQLSAAGFAVDEDLDRWQLRRDDTPWPINMAVAADGDFQSFDFLAAEFSSLETPYDVYWLELVEPGTDALRIPDVDGSPLGVPGVVGSTEASRTFEENILYGLALEQGDGRDHWFWGAVAAPGSIEVPFELPALLAGPGEIEIWLEGATNDVRSSRDHQTSVFVNDVYVGELSANGAGPYSKKLTLTPDVLIEGSNTLTLVGEPQASPDVVYLDRFRVSWLRPHTAAGVDIEFESSDGFLERIDGFEDDTVRVYQVSGPGAPQHIVDYEIGPGDDGFNLAFLPPTAALSDYRAVTDGGVHIAHAVIPSDHDPIPDPDGGADVIVIFPEALEEAVKPYVKFRRTVGLRVAPVVLEHIYDEYDDGRATTQAIKDFIHHAWTTWDGEAPRSVLLVGDASYDPLLHTSTGERHLIPTRLIETPEFQTSSDSWFVDLVGHDGLPELAIGRLPVATVEECAAAVRKILIHETLPPRSTRRRIVHLVSDDSDATEGFMEMNDALEPLFPVGLIVQRHDLEITDLDDLRDDLLDRWAAGAFLVHYTGHGGRRQWGGEGILEMGDIEDLTGGVRLPFVVAMNCWNALFQHPTSPSIGEQLVVEPEAGALAYWGPTGVSSNSGQQRLAVRFYEELFGSRILGQAILRAKRNVDMEGVSDPRLYLDTWNLLGDPELRLR